MLLSLPRERAGKYLLDFNCHPGGSSTLVMRTVSQYTRLSGIRSNVRF